MTSVDSTILGRLLMLQSALPATPDNQRLAELVCYSLAGIPGIESTALYLDDCLVSQADADHQNQSKWPADWQDAKQFSATESDRFISFPLQTHKEVYGSLALLIVDPYQVKGYLPHLENSVNLIALMLENRQQESELQDLNKGLEAQVQERVKSLQRSEERLALALVAAKSGLWDWNLKSGEFFFDANYFEMAGYQENEFPCSFEQWQMRVHPDDIAQAEARINAYLAGQSKQFTTEFRFMTKQGEWMWILGQGIVSERDKGGEPLRFTGTHTDINERKRAEEALRGNEEQLRITLDSIGDAVIATDAETRITRMNKVAEKLTGWQASDARGKKLENVFRLVTADERSPVENPAQKILNTGCSLGLASNSLLISLAGNEYIISNSAAPIRNSDNEMVGVVLVFRDVTEEKAVEDQLQQSQKMDTLGQLAGGVAHDFNNMLGGIIGATELLKRRLPDEDKTNKFLGMIMDSAERAADLTSKLLTFARKQPVSSTAVDVHLALRNAVSLIENTVDRRIQVTIDLAAEESTVIGESSQLQNVFLNLCINAAHAMPEGGELSISTQVLELDSVYCAVSKFDLQPGAYLDIQVRDNGYGISAANLERIFEPFFTTRAQGMGTGLGLAAVFGTVQMHHGSVAAYSEEGAGSVFSVLLPLTDVGPAIAETKAQTLSGTGLILIIDDEAVMRATAAAMLEDLGYEVLLAENGRIGLELFRDQSDKIDLVLLDMIMPEMNGRDCFVAMRKIDPDATILLSSGFTRGDDLSDLRSQGLAGFIRKPYRGTILSQRIAAALAREGNAVDLWG